MDQSSSSFSYDPQPNASLDQDLGFGNKIGQDVRRLINPDGSFNVRRTGAGWRAIHPYQVLISLSWGKFLLVVTFFFVLVNALFALAYLLVGMEHLAGSSGPAAPWTDQFGEAFYFSVQTFSTVGYGAISPKGHAANLLASFEALIGLLGFALATGVAFGRFSRPSAKISFSPNAIISPYQDINAFEFRVVNERKNQLINLEIQVVMTCSHWDGSMWVQKFYPLELERSKVTLFPMSWTIVHPITTASPLYNMTAESLAAARGEFLIIMSGYDDTFAQTVHRLSSYRYDEVLWGAKFVRNFHGDMEGNVVVEVDSGALRAGYPQPDGAAAQPEGN